MTLLKAWSEKKPMVDHLRIFSCETYTFIPNATLIEKCPKNAINETQGESWM
jgi:hypothetical protein